LAAEAKDEEHLHGLREDSELNAQAQSRSGAGKMRGGLVCFRAHVGAALSFARRFTMVLERITVDPNVCTGKPCIRGLRFLVSRRLGLLAAGETRESIPQAYPHLEPQDIDAVLQYPTALAEDETSDLSR
jgi:uncharacterized protein (DUF433 family)